VQRAQDLDAVTVLEFALAGHVLPKNRHGQPLGIQVTAFREETGSLGGLPGSAARGQLY